MIYLLPFSSKRCASFESQCSFLCYGLILLCFIIERIAAIFSVNWVTKMNFISFVVSIKMPWPYRYLRFETQHTFFIVLVLLFFATKIYWMMFRSIYQLNWMHAKILKGRLKPTDKFILKFLQITGRVQNETKVHAIVHNICILHISKYMFNGT